MVKKICIFVFLCFITLNFSDALASQAQEDAAKGKDITIVDTRDMRYHRTPIRKLLRGATNIITCPLEVPASMFSVAADEDNDFTGFVLGSFQGLWTALLRGLEGVFDFGTFIIPPYSKSIMTPEFAWDSLQQSYKAYDDENSVRH
ncbi:MAG: exosortase system-associated protein, TIGR04073 family [Candidatus Omnitrophica bacterium]|nr:exosortase system-associated protein, TIGR04073 family [Candidatus Omnitrophota bacterium]